MDDNRVTTSIVWRKAVEKAQQRKDGQVFISGLKLETAPNPGGVAPIRPEDTKQQLNLLEGKINGLIGQHDAKTERTKGFNNVFQTVLSVLVAANSAGAAAAAFNPYAALGWSTVQFLVSAAQTHKTVRAICWENIPRIAILISKYQLLEEVFTNSTGSPKTKRLLEEALKTLYVALLDYQVRMVLYIQSRRERLKAPFISEAASLPRTLLDKVTQLEDEVVKQTVMCSAETMVSTYAKVSDLANLRSTLESSEKAMNRISAGLEQISKVVESEYHSRVLE